MKDSRKRKYYSVVPKVVQSQTRQTIKIKGLYEHSRFEDGKEYRVLVEAVEQRGDGVYPIKEDLMIKAEEGTLAVSIFFVKEQEYQMTVFDGDKQVDIFCIYALDEDLYERYPYKGDLHMHTNYSDGVESPEYVAAACRQIGYDFMAITDHHKYQPSVISQEAYSGVKHDIEIYRGEEVHPVNRPGLFEKYVTVHILNIGGKSSVNDLYDDPDYLEKIEAIAAKTEVPAGVNAFDYASCVWAFDRIKECGGLSVFAHPYWRLFWGYHCSTMLAEYLIETKPFDAMEVISGYDDYDVDSNTLQVSMYHEYAKKGIQLPIIGVSDSHGAETGNYFGWYYTVAFAKSPKFEDVKESIMNYYSVAAEQMPNAAVRFYGPHRLVKYALFLYREVFPIHDEICEIEGRLMKEFAVTKNGEKLEKMSGSVEKLYKEMFARGCNGSN